MFTVIKSTKRSYGYELFFMGSPLSWLLNRHTCGWYEYKKDTEQRANELNYSL